MHANVLGPVSFFIHLKIGADEAVRRELFDCKADGICGARKSHVSERSPPKTPSFRGEQFSLHVVIEQLCLGRVVKGVHLVKRPSKTQSALDLRNMSEAGYRRPVHNDCTDGAHHGRPKKYRSTRTCWRIVLAGVTPFIGVGHEYHLAGKGHREEARKEAAASLSRSRPGERTFVLRPMSGVTSG